MTDRSAKQKRYGSLIRVLPEYEERYIILHKYTFPGVLQRIRESNIRNYSIYLRNGVLFSYYEYVGRDYGRDMKEMADDPVTQQWWKLTDPMQSPLEDRGEGEWWAGMPELLHLESARGTTVMPSGARRFAYVSGNKVSDPISAAGLQALFDSTSIRTLSLFSKDGILYCYLDHRGGGSLEKDQRAWEAVLTQELRAIVVKGSQNEWHPMREVFHTE